ncbi:hypothetical protein GCM10009744_59390 [Kribbella alba]|uniref:Polymerase nucleotidyl transferase domain-containing protein n=1 Tax=Kribbella alba TaxID=190197 RepID=A0ABP4RN79_9ACTN
MESIQQHRPGAHPNRELPAQRTSNNLPLDAFGSGDGTSAGTALSIAISGPDNVGKTTQIRILARRIGREAHLAGQLDHYDSRWPAIRNGGMADWWFHTASMEEVADVLASSYLERSRARLSATTWLVDRGMPMLEASVAATVAVREGIGHCQAADRARQLLKPFSHDIARAEASEFGVVLLQDDDPIVGVARSLEREPAVTETYVAYQQYLHDQLHRLVDERRFAVRIVAGGRSILAVQNDLRRHLRTVHTAVPEAALARIQVLALGGMSESGKSTVGEYLRTSHSHARLKIGYLIEEAASRCGIDQPYRADAAVRAELLVDSLDRYCAAHHFLCAASVESLHDYDSTRELRKLLGSQLSVLYVETSAAVRAIRGTAGPADVTERDAVKQERGASAIVRIADEVIDNNGTRLELERTIDRLVLTSRWPTVTPTAAPVEKLNLPAHLASYLSTLVNRLTGVSPVIDLLAVTGSGARGKYQQGWSDLDVLVIADQDCIPHLRAIVDELASELGGVKLGLTIVTLAECQAGAVTSRLLYVLRLIGTGTVIPLWRRPDLALPVPDADMDVDASVRDGIQAAVELRRQLLRPVPEVRDLYKVTALLAKIMLRFEGVECPSDDEALTVFLLRRHAEQHGGLLKDARMRLKQTQRLAAFVLDQWLFTLVPAGDAA